MRVTSVLSRAVLFALLWTALTGGAAQAWAYGAAATGIATWLSLRLYPADRPGIRIWRAVLFLPTLLVRGFLGGLDVARRALDPRLPVRPGWVTMPLGTRFGPAGALLGGVISILPGTLAAGPQDGTMDVHLLHADGFDPAELEREERRILGLFDRRIAGPVADDV
jgi:multicomponent Na+:H+ antiporter subunit E